MQTITCYCDLCNAKIFYGRQRLVLIDDVDNDDNEIDTIGYDLCPPCAKALKDWIDNRGMEVVDEKARKA